MKNHIIDAVIGAESITAMTTAVTSLNTEVAEFGIHLDEAQRKHSQKMGTRNETFAREMLEFAQQRPELVPAGISLAALQRDLAARDQVTPLLFQLKALTRTLEDTQMALGVDLYNGTRAMYKAVKPLAKINGVQDIISRIGQRFAAQGRRKTEPTPESMDSAGLQSSGESEPAVKPRSAPSGRLARGARFFVPASLALGTGAKTAPKDGKNPQFIPEQL